jgi:nucleoside-diphosphate-sugar epimerase
VLQVSILEILIVISFIILCFSDGNTLRTTALRPAGIYGEGEQRHLPRIVVRILQPHRMSQLALLLIIAQQGRGEG